MRKKKLAGIVGMVMLLLMGAYSGAWAKSARDVVVDYADEIYNYTWTTSKNIPRYHAETSPSSVTGTIRGIPYTYANMVSFQVYKALSDADRETVYSSNSMKYGMVCATFVTDCIRQGLPDKGLPIDNGVMFHKRSYNGFVSSVSDAVYNSNHELWDWRNIWVNVRDAQANSGYPAYKKLQKGDYLNDWNHVILVVDNDTSAKKITYIDQTSCWDSVSNGMVGTHKGTYTYSRLSEKYYIPMYVNYPNEIYTSTAPMITTTSLPDAYIGEPYYAQIETTGTAPVTFELSNAAAYSNGFRVDGNGPGFPSTNGIINGTPVNNLQSRTLPYTLSIKITAANAVGSDTKTFTVTVKERPIAPKITTMSLPDAYIGETYYAKINATGTTPIIYTINSGVPLSNGFNLDGGNLGECTSGIINGTPGYVAGTPTNRKTPYTVNFPVEATNSAGSDIKTFTITVKEKPVAPTITDYSFSDSYVGEPYKGYFKAKGTAPITYRISATGAANNLSCNSSTGDVTGTPQISRTFTMIIYAENSVGSVSKSISITIKERAVAPSITTASLPDGTEGESYSTAINAAGTTPITFSAAGLPSGLSCSNAGKITGTPSSAGQYTVRISAANSAGTVSRTLTLTINNKPVAPAVEANLPTCYVGEEYNGWIRVSGTTPITCTVSGLPSGLSRNSSTGTITGKAASAGTYTIKVDASNAAGSVSKSYSLTVKTRPVAPKITTSSLPDGKADESYSATLSATGTAPVSWSATGLPSGLSCSSSGTISGTPTQAGTYTVKITASNSAGNDTRSLTLNIAAKQETTTNEDDITETEKPKFKVANLTLSGQIAVNFYMNLPPIQGVNYYDGKNCYTGFDINGDTTSNNPQPVDGEFMSDGNYGFKCYVTSIQMADPITATFYYGNGKTVQCEYSVKKYLDNRISKTTSETMKNLAIAIKNFGHYAQVYLARVNGWTLGDTHMVLEAASDYTASDIESVRSVIDKYGVTMDSLEGTGIKGVSYSLSLNADTTINLTFKIKPEYTGSVSAYLNGGRENLAVKQSDGNYKVQISGISAHQLADTQTVKIYAGKEITLKVSGLTFVYTSMKGSNIPEDRQKLAVALYRYYETTMAYRKAQ